MKITYNNTPIPVDIFFLDTDYTIKNRIAWIVNTLPEYLYISNEIQNNDQVIFIDMWETVKNTPSLDDAVNKLEAHFAVDDVIFLWAMYHEHKFIIGIDNALNYKIETTDKQEFLSELNEEKRLFRVEQHNIIEFMRTMNNIQSENISEFDDAYSLVKVEFTCDKNSLYGVFDDLHVSSSIPLYTFNNFYKVLKNYSPPLNWLSPTSYILGKFLFNETYIDIEIHFIDDKFFLQIPSNPNYDVKDILKLIIPDYTVSEENAKSNIGSTFASSVSLDNNIFADLILTLDKIDKWLSVNDNIIHVEDFGNRNIYFRNPFADNMFVKASLTTKFNNETGQNYSSVKILSASDNDAIIMFRKFFGKILTLYKDNFKTIEGVYSSYIQIKKNPPVIVDKKKYFKDLIPRVFKPVNKKSKKYSEKCQGNKQPVIVENGTDTDLLFPSVKDSRITEPKYYRCVDPVYRFPGLIKFDNEMGVAPCCFKNNQQNKNIYTNYYSGKEIPKKNVNQYLKKTDKPIELGEYGYFPDSDLIINNIGQMLQMENNRRNVILRKGVDNFPNSFLDCVLTALQDPRIINTIGQERQNIIKSIRKDLVQYQNVGMQEMYGESQTSIREYLENVDLYLDPQKVIRIVEHAFNCNILLFVKNSQYPTGELIVPRHANGYCRFKRDDSKPSIFIFNHTGTAKEESLYPHCELVIQTPRGEQPSPFSVWNYNNGLDPIYNFCWKVYDRLSTYYYRQLPVLPIPITLKTTLNVTRQYVDENGKVRLLEVWFKNTAFIIETTPLPPFNVPILNTNKPSLVSTDFIKKYIRHLRIKVSHEYQVKGVTQFFYWNYKDLFYMKIFVESENQLLYSEENKFKDYVNYSKISRYLTNWSLYLFSNYIKDNNDNIDIQSFVNSNILVSNDYKYDVDNVSETFDLNQASGIFSNGYLVCDSEELLKRLVFRLRLLLERDSVKVKKFHTRKIMESFYVSAYDFKNYINEYILYYNPESSLRLVDILTTKIKGHTLYSYPPNNEEAFFFKNSHISDTILLSQNTETVGKALSVGTIWSENGYNSVDSNITLRQTDPYYLTTLSSSHVAKTYQVLDGVVENNLHVLATKNTLSCLMILNLLK